MPNTPDTVYDNRPWNRPPGGLPYSYERPWASHEERMVSQALAVGDVPGRVLQSIQAPLPQVDPWRPRTGYRTTALGIDDVVRVDRLYPDNRVSWSGGPGSYQGASRNSLGTV